MNFATLGERRTRRETETDRDRDTEREGGRRDRERERERETPLADVHRALTSCIDGTGVNSTGGIGSAQPATHTVSSQVHSNSRETGAETAGDKRGVLTR